MWQLITQNCPCFIRGGPEAKLLLTQVLHGSATAWPWHHTRYLGGVLSGLPDTPSSGLKIPQMKSFFRVTVRRPQKIQSALWITVLQISAGFGRQVEVSYF